MQQTFKALEQQSWNERAATYDAVSSRITNFGIAPLLDVAGVGPGQKLLDVCCGTGLVAVRALDRGADVVGIDISEEMVAAATAKRLRATFRTGDAEALPFPDAVFDRVICNFGLFHVAEPDRAIAEAARVLRHGGRYAFTTWCGPEVSPLFRIIPAAIQAYGVMDVGLPPGPPPFRLADRAESTRVMMANRFMDVVTSNMTAFLEWPLASVIEFIEQGTVRAAVILRAQRPEARALIDSDIKAKLAPYAVDGVLRLPMPAIVVSGTRT
ncbi:MAG TPA: methyltransferase domain-containing protein [Burkholderiaceae bacterium]|nr:methyltransferase domain-containing protein [Burkholderiaceae bacterium]